MTKKGRAAGACTAVQKDQQERVLCACTAGRTEARAEQPVDCQLKLSGGMC